MNNLVKCRICGSKEQNVLYAGDVRSGVVGQSEQGFKVVACDQCSVSYLSPCKEIDYESEEYRELYNDTSLIDDYFKMHDRKQLNFTTIIREDLRGKVIADFGCGGGALLDYFKNVAIDTIAIEPFLGYHESLKSRGHTVYQYTDQYAKDSSVPRCDIGVSSHVIEHVENPIQYLKEISQTMKSGGVLYVATPNSEDILLDLCPTEFSAFFYRTAHAWYFNKKSLEWVAKEAGFEDGEVFYRQNYGLQNAFSWTKERKPFVNSQLPFFDNRIDNAWRSFVEDIGRADEILIRLTK